MDLVEYIEGHGKVRLITTCDCKIKPLVFPLLELVKGRPEFDTWTFSMRGLNADGVDMDYRVDFLGRVRCARPDCGLLILNTPIACKACLRDERHKRGRPGPGCRNARCPGHPDDSVTEPAIVTEVTRTTTAAEPALASPRWRVFGRQPSGTVITPPRDRSPARSRSDSPRPVEDASMDVDSEGEVRPSPTVEASVRAPETVGLPNLAATKKVSSSAPQKACHGARGKKEKLHDARKSQREFENMYLRHGRDISELRREVGHAFGLVTRVVRSTSDEALSNTDAQKSMQAEIDNLLQKRALDVDGIMEYDGVVRNFPDAEFVRGGLLLGVQNSGLDVASHRWKARFVALGDNVFSTWGERIWEEVIQTTPVGLPEVRLAMGHQSLFSSGIGMHGDVDGAYLTTEIGGKPKFLITPKPILSTVPKSKQHFRRPCARIRRALYGLKRAAADFGEKARRILQPLGFTEIRDVTASVYYKWPVMIIVKMATHRLSQFRLSDWKISKI